MSAISAQVVLPARRPRPSHASDTHLVLVANGSASGLGRSRDVLEEARRALRSRGYRVEVYRTESVGELADAWPAFQDRRVVLLGGDGTVHAAANLPFAPPELALLPAGRANNIARALGIPLDLSAAAELATSGTARPIDLIAATDGARRLLAVEGVSVGLHALARASYRAPNSADIRAAIRSGISAARTFDGITVCISSDGQMEMLPRVGQLFVANLSLYAFGLQVAPDARPDDGALDVVVLPWEGRAHILSMIARLRRGTHGRRPRTRMWTARSVRIGTRGQSPVIADTTNLGAGPMTLEVVPAALALVRP